MSDLCPLTIRKTWAFYGKTDYNDMTCRNSNNHKKMRIHLFKQTVLKRGCHWGREFSVSKSILAQIHSCRVQFSFMRVA